MIDFCPYNKKKHLLPCVVAILPHIGLLLLIVASVLVLLWLYYIAPPSTIDSKHTFELCDNQIVT